MAIYKSGGYTRKGVVYQGPTRPKGRPTKAVIVSKASKTVISKAVNKTNHKNIASIVKQVLKGDEEVKQVYNTDIANNLLIYGAGVDFGPLTKGFVSASLIPNPSLAVNSAGRIGNMINPKGLSVRYTLYANPTTDNNSTTNNNPFVGLPFFVRVVIYKHRYSTSDSSPMNIINDGATSISLNNDVDAYFRPYNKDEFIIAYSKTHRMEPARYTAAAFASAQAQDPRASSFVVKNVSLRLPKHLIYNDNASAYPTNAAWYMAVAVCNMDGSTITATTAGQSRVKLNVESYLRFTDP